MISLLLPSRDRPEPLRRSVYMAYSLAADVNNVEVLIGNDPDDETTAEVGRELHERYEGVRVIRTARRFGYRQFNEYFNILAGYANGDWLVLWNDDALMQTFHWDLRLLAQEPGVATLITVNHRPFNTFPAVHRKVYEAMGHYSLSIHCDSWVHDVGQEAGCLQETGIEVLHDRADLTGNNNDAIYAETHANYQTHQYYSQEMADLRHADAVKVKEALG